jgi:hypothetical protein
MLRLSLSGDPILRNLLVLLLALAPLGAPRAAVSVSADMGGNIGQVSCANATSINFHLDQGIFAFICGTDQLTYSCTPTQIINYDPGAGAITMTCDNGSARGLVVNAMVDGVQNGNGNKDGFCNNAQNFSFDTRQGMYGWTCDNGGGSVKSVACFTSQNPSAFNTAMNQVDMDCVTLFMRSSYEDYEPEAPPPPAL